MKLSGKILTVVLSIVSILLGLLLITGMVWLPFDEAAVDALAAFLGHPVTALCVAVGSLGLITLAVFTMLSLFGKKPETRIPVVKSENGDTFLTVSALVSTVRQYLAMEHITNEARIEAAAVEGGADVTVTLRVLPDTVMADFSDRLQKGVKEHLETLAGVKVNRVTVVLETLPAETAQPAQRVR